MPRLPLAVLCLGLAASAAADDAMSNLQKEAKGGAPPVPVAAAHAKGIRFPGCSADDQRAMDASIDDVMDKVKNCLNKWNGGKMSQAILANFSKIKYSCSQKPSIEGGETTHVMRNGQLQSANIEMTMHATGTQYFFTDRLFHEMIHAIDPPSRDAGADHKDGHYIDSAQMHAVMGYPDPVYACQKMCYGLVTDDEAKTIAHQSSVNGFSVPPYEKDLPCDASKENCPAKSQYAYLCETAKPLASKDAIAKARAEHLKSSMPDCLAMALSNDGCPSVTSLASCSAKQSPLCGLRCEFFDGIKDGKYPASLAKRFAGLGQRLTDAYLDGAEVSDEDKPIYAAAKSKGLFKSCEK